MTTAIKSKRYKDIQVENDTTILTGIDIFDDFYSKKRGFVIGTFNFFTGTSGAGKTTLMVNLMKALKEMVSIYYAREATSASIKDQLGSVIDHDNAYFADRRTHATFKDFMEELHVLKPRFVVVDSIQAIAMEDFMDISEDEASNRMRIELAHYAEDNNAVVIAIGHVNKDNTHKGSNTIMHMSDVHLMAKEESNEGLPSVRKLYFGQKNRKGKKDKLLYYEINNDGTVSFFTREEYLPKLQEIEALKAEMKAPVSGPVNLVSEVENTLNRFIKSIDKNHADYPEFIKFADEQRKVLGKLYSKDKFMFVMEFYGMVSRRARFLKLL